MMENSPFRIPQVTRSGIPERLFEKILGLTSLEKRYETLGGGHYQGKEFLQRLLKSLNVKHQVTLGSNESIPVSGPSVVVANHPFGGIEGVALADRLLSIRDDVKVLTNELLSRIPDVQDIFIGVDVIGKNRKEKNRDKIDEAQQWVKDGHLLLIFPAGEVSSFEKKQNKVVDPLWRLTAARIIHNTHASVTPVFVEGRNGWLFQFLGLIHPKLRTAKLVRELTNKEGATINFRIGPLFEAEQLNKLTSDTALTNYLRLHTYLLGATKALKKTQPLTDTATNRLTPVIPPVSGQHLQQDVNSLPADALLLKKGSMVVYCTQACHIPNLLREIGRLRELTFRTIGEGTGKALDIDRYDQYYLHLFLWNTDKKEVVGAYRIAEVEKIVRQQGVHGLYSRSLFRYHQAFIQQMSVSLEMGRSFIRPEYQKALSPLLLLWKGIGAFIAANPHYQILFGPVSISSDYSRLSRQLMTTCLQTNYLNQNVAALVQPITPLKQPVFRLWQGSDLAGIHDIEYLSTLVRQIEPDNKGVPVLLRQYLKLQGQFAAFNIDPNFNDALDGLIIVNLTHLKHKVLKRYLGDKQAKLYRKYHHPSE